MPKGILCPACESKKTKVYETRPSQDGILRRRQCLECDSRFATLEYVTHMIRLMDSSSVKRGREENFPSDLHIITLKAIASGAQNRNQIALATGISKEHVKRIVGRLVQARLVELIHGALVEGDVHPLTVVVQITHEGASFLAKSNPPKKCDDR